MSDYCGSERGYRDHRSRGETTCTACRAAHNLQARGGEPLRGPGKSRSVAVVAASARNFCALCESLGRVRLVALPGMRGSGVASCPHCSPEPGRDSLPIRNYFRFRTDVPRDEIA